jgi:hypothetical protein
MAKSPSIHRWRIVRTPTTTIGYVEASDERAAIERAIRKFNIAPGVVGKLIAEKIKSQAHRK